jgi:hypothetical protein
LVFLVPLVVDLCVSSRERIFGWVAADTFYYLVYAQRTLATGIVSYDGQFWSNGFHPLWMAFVILEQALQPRAGTHIDLYFLVGIGALLQAASFVIWSRVLRRPDGRLTSWFVALPVGFYAAIVCPFWLSLSSAELRAQDPWSGSEPVYGTAWSFANGLESSLTLLLFAVVALAFCRLDISSSHRRAMALGALLCLFTLSRLDHVFITASLWCVLTLRACPWSGRGAAKQWGILTGSLAVPLGIYLLANYLVFDSALPVSGRLKSTLPFVTTDNFAAMVDVYNSFFGGARPPIYVCWRVLQSVVPAFCALLAPFALVSARFHAGRVTLTWHGRARLGQLLAGTAVGVLLLSIYDFAFVPGMHTGHWYFPVSILLVSLLGVIALDRAGSALRRISANWPVQSLASPSVQGPLRLVLQASLALASLAFFVRLHRHTDYNERYATFYFEERANIRAVFKGKEPKLLCLDDGIVAYVTGFPAMSATGFALDARAAKSFRRGRLLDLAQKRGFDHLTSLVYVDHSALRRSPPDVGQWRKNTHGFGDLKGRRLEVAYVSPSLNFAMVRMSLGGPTAP